MSDLKKQAVNSVMWTTVRTAISSLSGPLLLVVKARYLTPAEFGVLAIINVFVSFITVIENFGFSTAVIQRDTVSKNERSSLFYFQVFFCIFLGVLLILISPVVSDIFDMPALTNLLPLLSLSIFLNGPVILFTAFLEKEFHFKELSIIQIVRETSLLIFTAILLIFGYGLLGVVIGQVIAVAIMAVLIVMVSFKHGLLHLKFHFRLHEVRPFIKFGLYIAGKQLLTQFTHHVDEVIIGYFLSAEVLGYYHFAKNMIGKLRNLITTSFAKVLFPILSKVKNDLKRLTSSYNNISKYLGIFAFPIFIGVALTANLFVPALFGEEWIGSIDYFVILSIAHIPYLLTANLATSLLYSVNKPNIVLNTDLVVNSIYILLLLVVSWLELGIIYVVWLYALYLVVKSTVLQYYTSNYLHTTFKQYLALFKYVVISSVVMMFAILAAEYLVAYINNDMLELILTIIIGAVVYTTTYFLLDRKSVIEIKTLINFR